MFVDPSFCLRERNGKGGGALPLNKQQDGVEFPKATSGLDAVVSDGQSIRQTALARIASASHPPAKANLGLGRSEMGYSELKLK